MATARKHSAFFRGADGMRRTEEEIELSKRKSEERKAAGNQPFRFRTPEGESRRAIVCDDKPDFFMYEHGLKDAEGNWGRLFCGCTKTFDNCPACEVTGKESYYGMYLTVIDLTPFTLRDGTEVEFSRKLLVVKPAQQKKFLRFYNKEGTLRGAMFEFTRDGPKDSAIGNDIEFIEFVPEDEMQTYTRSWKDREGKKHTENCDEPFVYEDLFEEPTTEKIRAIVGGAPTPGSRAHSERELGGRGRSERTERGGRTERAERPARGRDDDWEPDADGAPFDADEPRRGRAAEGEERPARRTRAAEPADEPTRPATRTRRAVEEPDPEPVPARRTRAAPPEDDPEPAPARRGRAAPTDDDPEPAPRRGRAAPAAEEPAPRRGRAAEPADPDDDSPVARAAARRAARR